MALSIYRAKPIPVKDEDGNIVGYLRFDPADPTILARFKELVNKLGEMIEEHDARAQEDTVENRINDILLADRVCREEIDKALGCEASKLFFSELGPLSMLEDGTYYVHYIFRELTTLVEDAVRKASEESSKRVHDKIDKYAEQFAAEEKETNA